LWLEVEVDGDVMWLCEVEVDGEGFVDCVESDNSSGKSHESTKGGNKDEISSSVSFGKVHDGRSAL
jgi:hypothetical protein